MLTAWSPHEKNRNKQNSIDITDLRKLGRAFLRVVKSHSTTLLLFFNLVFTALDNIPGVLEWQTDIHNTLFMKYETYSQIQLTHAKTKEINGSHTLVWWCHRGVSVVHSGNVSTQSLRSLTCGPPDSISCTVLIKRPVTKYRLGIEDELKVLTFLL